MNVFISITSGESQYKKSLKSCYGLTRRDGDAVFEPEHVTHHGQSTRGDFLMGFLERTRYDAWLMLDGDQVHPENMLEVLRDSLEAHDLDMVCAHYYARSAGTIQSLCYELGDGTWPFLPMLDPPRSGLHEIAWTGLGCVLLKRDVVAKVQALMPTHRNCMDLGPMPHWTGDYRECGSDFRFFMMARQLGYRLWLNADVESLHMTTFPLGHQAADKLKDYIQWADNQTSLVKERLKRHGVTLESARQRLRLLEARYRGMETERDNELNDPTPNQEKLGALNATMFVMQGRLLELDNWMTWLKEYPPITRPDQLPTTESSPRVPPWELMPDDDTAAIAARIGGHKKLAEELTEALPNVNGHQ